MMLNQLTPSEPHHLNLMFKEPHHILLVKIRNQFHSPKLLPKKEFIDLMPHYKDTPYMLPSKSEQFILQQLYSLIHQFTIGMKKKIVSVKWVKLHRSKWITSMNNLDSRSLLLIDLTIFMIPSQLNLKLFQMLNYMEMFMPRINHWHLTMKELWEME
jgi:hypothetical protein